MNDVYIHLGSTQTGGVDRVGPFDYVQVTYDRLVRVGSAAEYPDDFTIATFRDGLWHLDDGSEWTDLTIATAE